MRPIWKLRERLGGTKVRIGRRFSLQGQLRMSGPGTVVIGDDVIVDSICTPYTHAPDAKIEIAAKSFVNGTRFGCSKRIEVGEGCILADARIMDTDFHAVHRNRNSKGAVPSCAEVIIGKNVWVGAGAAVLKGTRIGDDSVIAFGSVVTHAVPSGRIFGGNPARDLGEVSDDYARV